MNGVIELNLTEGLLQRRMKVRLCVLHATVESVWTPVWRTKIAQFRTHYLTKELACVSTQSGQDTMDTKMI